jgi:hypothetical protein
VDAADTEQTSVSPGVQATPSNPAGAATTSADVASHLDVCLAVRDVAAAIDANPAYLPEAVAVQIFGKLAPETADQVEWLRANADAVARSDCPAELDTVLAQGRIDSLSPIFR